MPAFLKEVVYTIHYLRLTCLMATSPIFAECFLIFSRKSFRSVIDASLILFRSCGIASAMVWENQ